MLHAGAWDKIFWEITWTQGEDNSFNICSLKNYNREYKGVTGMMELDNNPVEFNN